MSFKSKLKHLCIDNQTNIISLSKELKIDHNFLYNLANGKSKYINLDYLSRLMKRFNCQMSDLIEFQPQKPKKAVKNGKA
jgi:DNA-binding Xre family transcriptional regulator